MHERVWRNAWHTENAAEMLAIHIIFYYNIAVRKISMQNVIKLVAS